MARAGVLVLAGLGAMAPPAVSQTEADQQRVDRQIQSTRAMVGEASAQETRLLGLMDESRRRERELAAKLTVVQDQLATVGRELDEAQIRLAAVEARQSGAQARLDELRGQLEDSRRALTSQAITAYTGQSEAARYVGMWLHADSADDLVSKRSYLRWAVGSQTEVIAAAERLRNEVADRRDELAGTRRATAAERDTVEAQQERLVTNRNAQESLRRESAEELATRDRLRGEALARKREFQAALDSLERESRAIAETLRRRAEASGGSPGGGAAPGRLQMPIPGAAITSSFGPRVHPIYGDVRSHTGIDFNATAGTPIRSAAAGVVVSASTLGGYGNCTLVDHGGGLVTLYAHQSSMAVRAGERVAAGQVIGRVGSTGASTGAHLHFEVRRSGEPVNPAPFL